MSNHPNKAQVFEGAAFDPVGVPELIVPDDSNLVATANLFGLAI